MLALGALSVVRREVSGTPTYFVGDRRLEGGVPEHLLATLLAERADTPAP